MSVSDYTPTVQEVARMLRARTRNQAGELVRDFTDDTLPTAEDVQGLIEEAADEVTADISPDALLSSEYYEAARVLVILLASANVELSYWPEQAAQTNSMYDKLMARFNAKEAALIEAMGGGIDDSVPPVDEFSTNWNTIGGGFPQPMIWENPYRRW
jgi:hypothetical protein